MIHKIVTNCCPHCQSANIVKNGHNPKGKQPYRCKQCGKSGVLDPEVRYTAEQKERILAAYYERPSLRGIERVFGVARETVAAWLKKSPATATTHRYASAGQSRRRTGAR